MTMFKKCPENFERFCDYRLSTFYICLVVISTPSKLTKESRQDIALLFLSSFFLVQLFIMLDI